MINKSEVKNILITRTDRLGDVILTLPLVHAAHKIFKDSTVFFLVKKYAAEILDGYEGIDELVLEEDHAGFSAKYNYFKNKKIDLAINVKPAFSLAFLFFILRIKYRVGTAYRWYSFLYNCKVHQHRKHSGKHESQLNLNLLLSFFGDITFQPEFHFKYSDEERAKLREKLIRDDFDLNSEYIIVHPGSGGSAKDLPIEKLTEFINAFSAKFKNCKIVLTGIESEKVLTGKIIDGAQVPECIYDFAGKFDLKELLILIDNCKMFISNSTGPIHIAGALNKNVIGFYPDEKPMDDARWGPLSANSVVIKPAAGAGNMENIKADDIVMAAEQLMKKLN